MFIVSSVYFADDNHSPQIRTLIFNTVEDFVTEFLSIFRPITPFIAHKHHSQREYPYTNAINSVKSSVIFIDTGGRQIDISTNLIKAFGTFCDQGRIISQWAQGTDDTNGAEIVLGMLRLQLKQLVENAILASE